jgi:drug/metabolite transporter (DMT)-like permease
MKPKDWFFFIALGAIWSSSFLWIKIALDEIGPLTLVAFRVLFGLLTGVVISLAQRVPWPRDWRTWRVYLLLGVTNVVIPFVLITWGEKSIDSSVAAVLNSTVPLFTLLLAHFFVHDDRITVPKLAGLLLGFLGVVALMSRDILTSSHNSLLGQAAVVLASISYAASYIIVRRSTVDAPGQIRGILPFASATLIMWSAAPVFEAPFKVPALPITWIALLWLGILGSGLAYTIQYNLVHSIGPTRSTMVSYIFPLGGVLLGMIFRGENLTWQLGIGAVLIVSSIAVVNAKFSKTTPQESATPTTEIK